MQNMSVVQALEAPSSFRLKSVTGTATVSSATSATLPWWAAVSLSTRATFCALSAAATERTVHTEHTRASLVI